MGYKKKAKDAYEACKPLIVELHELEEWFAAERAKFEQERKEKLKKLGKKEAIKDAGKEKLQIMLASLDGLKYLIIILITLFFVREVLKFLWQ